LSKSNDVVNVAYFPHVVLVILVAAAAAAAGAAAAIKGPYKSYLLVLIYLMPK